MVGDGLGPFPQCWAACLVLKVGPMMVLVMQQGCHMLDTMLGGIPEKGYTLQQGARC